MSVCVCCCPNRPEEIGELSFDGGITFVATGGKYCICEDATQIVIDVPDLITPPGGLAQNCEGTGAILVADLVNELQEVGGGWRVLPTVCGFIIRTVFRPFECLHLGPGVSGSLRVETPFAPDQILVAQFFDSVPGSGGQVSLSGESCDSFAARYDRRIFHTSNTFGPPCDAVIGGGWTLQ
jgi:hypothetical protein